MKFQYVDDIQLQRQHLLTSDAAKPFIDEILPAADNAIAEPSHAFRMSEFMLYYESGNRSIFEQGYFGRRRNCFNIAAAYWLTEDEKYHTPLIDHISYICDEFTWCVPAHAEFFKQSVQDVIEHVELFQAETARFFAELIMCLGDKLPAYLQERMRLEVRRRIFASLLKGKKYDWETADHNWATVCGAGCALAALYFGDEADQTAILPRCFGSIDSYLSGIKEDGCCQEGMAYWGYGFSHFIILANIIKACNGTDYFKLPKVRQLALFPQRIRMSDSKILSVSDGREDFYFKVGQLCFLKKIFPEVTLPDLHYGILRGNIDSFSELLWFDADYKQDSLLQESFYFDQTEWYINKQPKFSFAAKGGNNNEPHNHNDIGSFMITVGEEVFISDLGSGEYVKETFQPETRYQFLQNSSRGHSVPIVSGQYQCFGKAYSAKNTSASQNTFELDMDGAYQEGLVEQLHRRFEISEDKVTLTDTVIGAVLTERFISKREPKLYDGYVDLGCGKILYEKSAYSVRVNTETLTAHNAVDIVTVYQIDFEPKDQNHPVYQFDFVF